jgi:O-antigen/teichoic acid export membrane protein
VSHTLARNTLYLTVATVGQKIIAFVYFLFLARIMQPENTGAYFLATSLVLMFSVVADFGVTPVLVREIAKWPERSVSFARRALAVKLVLMILGAIGVVIAGALLGYEAEIRSLIIIGSFILMLDALHLFFYGLIRAHHTLEQESVGMFLGMFTTAAFGGLVLWISPSLFLLMFALLAGSVVNVVIAAGTSVRRFGARVLLPQWDPIFTKRILRMALPFALGAVFVKVYSYVDSIMIAKFLGTVEVGLYSIAYKFTYAFQFVPLAFVASLYPSFAQNSNDPKNLAKLFERSIWYMAMVAVPITLGLWLVAPEAVILAGTEYASASQVLRLLVFVLLPIFLDFPIGSLLNAANRQTLKTTIMGITMIVNVLLNFWLIPLLGIVGAAISALVSFSFMFLSGLLFVRQILKGYKFAGLFKLLAPIALGGLVMLLIGWIIKPTVGWVLTMPICAIVYLFILMRSGSLSMNDLRSLADLRSGRESKA